MSRARHLIWIVIALGAVEMVLLAIWQRDGYWEFSDGVYADTAQLLVHGHALYRSVAAAQPPPVYLVGALLLRIHDGLAALRAGLALVQLVTVALVAWCVWRLSGRATVAIIAGLLAPLIPITLHEHAQLLPETLAAPLVLGGALLCAGRDRAAAGWAPTGAARDRAVAGGVLLACASACKLAFGLPALAIVLACAARRRALAGLVGAGIVLAGATLVAFGAPVWREAVRAQLQVGASTTHAIAGLLAQAAWNELPLVVGAALAVWQARRARDTELLRTLTAAAVASVVLALTVYKRGSYIDVLVVAEPALLALAACGVVWSWDRIAIRGPVVVLGALLAAQVLSLLIDPGDPVLARRPGASSGLEYALSPAAVNRKVAAARRCPPSSAVSTVPYVAFLAGRRMPGDQPDLFIITAPINAPFARRADADTPSCDTGG